jgi:glycosyltransferase involved in cell wall biosynthesis
MSDSRAAPGLVLQRNAAFTLPGPQAAPPPDARRAGFGTAGPRIAVLIPCFNEEAAVPRVVAGFRASLPEATIHVFDNNSRDRTAEVARAAGAHVRNERMQGKGHVVRRMFADVEADVFVLVDGDDTYDAAAAPTMVRMLVEGQLDMVTATRESAGRDAFPRGHRAGNALLAGIVRWVFGNRVSDVLSGYRVFSRRFVKSFPALAAGFETETEFTVHALELCMPIGELRTRYRGRAAGSASKLRTWADGLRILRAIVKLVKEERPLRFFAACGVLLLMAGIGAGLPLVLEYLRSGLVPRLPTAVLATGLVLASMLALACGLILESVARGRKEMKRLAYLAVPR